MHRIESTNYIVESGKNKFSNTPPATTLDAEWCNSVQEEISHVIEQSGISLKTKSSDSQTQLWEAIQTSTQVYDVIVGSQAVFNSIIERTGANAYRFKAGYTSVYFKYVVGGYAVAGASSFLSGGDTYGVLTPNEMLNMYFAPGAYLNCADTPFYLNCNKSGTVYTNVVIQGAASSAVAVTDGFLLGNTYNKFINCGVKTRLSNVAMTGFKGSVNEIDNSTVIFKDCYVDGLTSSDEVFGFYLCHKLQTCLAYNILSSSNCYGFYTCYQVSNCKAFGVNGASAGAGFHTCEILSSCFAKNIDSSNAYGFYICNSISCSKAEEIDGNSGGVGNGFNTCSQISACRATDIDSTGHAFGFNGCSNISACVTDDIDSSGGNTYGFFQCTYGSSLYTSEAANPNNDYIDTTDVAVTNKVSCPAIFT